MVEGKPQNHAFVGFVTV